MSLDERAGELIFHSPDSSREDGDSKRDCDEEESDETRRVGEEVGRRIPAALERKNEGEGVLVAWRDSSCVGSGVGTRLDVEMELRRREGMAKEGIDRELGCEGGSR